MGQYHSWSTKISLICFNPLINTRIRRWEKFIELHKKIGLLFSTILNHLWKGSSCQNLKSHFSTFWLIPLGEFSKYSCIAQRIHLIFLYNHEINQKIVRASLKRNFKNPHYLSLVHDYLETKTFFSKLWHCSFSTFIVSDIHSK